MVELWHHLWLIFDHVWHKYLTRCDEWTLLGIWLFCSLDASHPPIKTDKCLMEPERLYSVQAFVWTDLHIGLWPDVLGHFELFTLGLGEASWISRHLWKYQSFFLPSVFAQIWFSKPGKCTAGCESASRALQFWNDMHGLQWDWHTAHWHTAWHTAWQLLPTILRWSPRILDRQRRQI